MKVTQFEGFVTESVLRPFKVREFLHPPTVSVQAWFCYFEILLQNFQNDADYVIDFGNKFLLQFYEHCWGFSCQVQV